MATKVTPTPERVGRVGQRRQVVIPKDILETLNLREGDFVAFAEQKNGVLIKPKRSPGPDDTLTPGEAAKLRHAQKQANTGKTRAWATIKHELGL